MKVNLTIDGQKIQTESGKTILEVAEEAGINIPTLCHHPALPPEGSCRICLVEIERQRSLQTSCTFPATEGLVVYTRSPKVMESRKFVLEMLISDHPTDCMTCEASSNCLLQDLVYEYGVDTDIAPGLRHDYPVEDPNPFIQVDRNKCILCRRCVRACNYLNGVEAIGIVNRGFNAYISFGADAFMAESPCEFCGMCAEVCPTGALTPKMSLGKGRTWQTKKVQTTCTFCGVGCQLLLEVKDNQIVKIDSVWDGPANHGWTCVKGRFGYDFVNHPDRLSKPKVRKYLLDGTPKPKDRGDWVEVDWDTALEVTAQKLLRVRDTHGPDSIGLLSSAKCTNEENYLMNKFARQVIGTNNIDHCARLCHSSTVAGLAIAFGSGAMSNSIEDISNQASLFFVIGSNTTEQHPVIGMRIRQAVKQRGAVLIVADPRRIPLTDFATLHLQHRPGTDNALINGLQKIILDKGYQDQEFINERTEGFEEFRANLAEYTPEIVSDITSVPVEQLYEAAEIMGTHKPMAVVWAMGITQHTTGVHNVLNMANMQMLLGNMGIAGGGVNPLRGQNNVQGACDVGGLPNVYPGYQAVNNIEAQKKFQDAWGVPLSPAVGLTVTEMLPGILDGKIQALYILGENPIMSDPDTNHIRHCLEECDFMVLQDIFPTETSHYADVLLPGVTFAEKYGTFTNTERSVQMVHQAIEPLGEARQDWCITADLANRFLQISNREVQEAPFSGWEYASSSNIMQEITALTPSYAGISHERLDRDGGLQWPVPDSNHPGTPILHIGKFTRGLGKFTPIDYIPPAELPDEDYPIVLSTGRVLYHWHGGEMTRRAKGLLEIYSKPLIEVNYEDAQRLGLNGSKRVRVTSRRGTIEAEACVTDRVPPGMIFGNFHFPEASVNVLTINALDPVAKIPEYKVCAVKVEAI